MRIFAKATEKEQTDRQEENKKERREYQGESGKRDRSSFAVSSHLSKSGITRQRPPVGSCVGGPPRAGVSPKGPQPVSDRERGERRRDADPALDRVVRTANPCSKDQMKSWMGEHLDGVVKRALNLESEDRGVNLGSATNCVTLGPAAPQEPPFPDIYGGDAQLWEAHFRGIGRAYRALGKEDDFAIRVLTEDFTLPFPYAWPPGPDPARGPLFYDPQDRTGFDFLLRPGAPPPALLRPLHATAQAFLRKRRLEQLALSYASSGGGAAPHPGVVLLAPAPGPNKFPTPGLPDGKGARAPLV
ncbi:uncharacterized protein C8orf90 homolog [Monodelphis domestica]|uniref:uncharacterized protein C8orf90 homolog n=1 Tax=Monodelphis domestica TaxID=13616 RepID=UPI0024E1C50E|nr:uncharacterized protein C8orf90 homolog [Monodelphis domestica]